MEEREPVGILVGFERRFVHQAADGKMSHHEPIEFLANEIRCLAAQHDSGAAQVGLKFVERGFDFPPLMIEGRQLRSRGVLVIEDGGDEPIDRLGVGDAVEAIARAPVCHWSCGANLARTGRIG